MARFFQMLTGVAVVAAAPLTAHLLTDQKPAPSQPSAVVASQAARQQKAKEKAPHTTPNYAAPHTVIITSEPAGVADAHIDGFAQGRTELVTTICRFLREYTGGQAAAPGNGSICPNANPTDLRVVVAVIPDPVHTHLALRFDRSIDDIQDAAQDLNWNFDSSWLPWDNRTHEESDRYEEREEDTQAQRGREENPGVLLFRGNEGQAESVKENQPLIVLVVGDTPTSGVNPTQFRNAISSWKELTVLKRRASGQPVVENLQIIGPSFSGSIPSMRQIIEEQLQDSQICAAGPGKLKLQNIDIVSGSVSRSDQLTALQKPLNACGDTLDSSHLHPVSFGVSGSYQTNEFIHFFEVHKIPLDQVAELSESETAFGKGPIPQDTKWHSKHFYFPREISQLRKAYERNSIIGFSNATSGPRTQLSLTDSDDLNSIDTVPSFSGQRETLALETEMSSIAANLTENRISTVLLNASDVLDEIFVARFLQKHDPSLTVIIEDADVLFLRRGADAGLDNTYVVSPWPLIQENEQWSAPTGTLPKQQAFQARDDEGLYNGSILLLSAAGGGRSIAQDISSPSVSDADILEYRSPFLSPANSFARRPPLWLTVINHGRFSPIALVDVDQPETEPHPYNLIDIGASNPQPGAANPQGIITHLTLATKICVAFIAMLLFWHGIACFRARLDRHFAWTYALAEKEYRRRRLWLQAAIAFSAVPALILLDVPSVPGFTIQSRTFGGWILFLEIVAAVLAAWPLVRLFGAGEFVTREDTKKSILVWIVFFAAIFLPSLIIDNFIWGFIAPAPATERNFFLYRCSLFYPGSSPSLTLLLLYAACALWLHSHFGRMAFFGHRIPDLPKSHEAIRCPSPKQLTHITDLFTTLRSWNGILLVLVGLALAVTLSIAATWAPHSLAHGNFDNSVGILAALLALAIFHDIAVATCGWHLLRRYCLLPLRDSSLRWGFTWIKGFSWRRIWTSYQNLSPEIMFDYLSRLREANDRVGADPALQTAYITLREKFFQPGDKNEAWAIDVATRFIGLHTALAKAAARKLDELQPEWEHDIGPLTGADAERGMHYLQPISDDLKDEPADLARTRALHRMANEEFVALLYLGYIRMVLIQIRNRIVTACVTYILLLWALTSYPWTNHHAIILALTFSLIIISGAILYIYSGMHRDDILSRTTETTPGKLDPEFFAKVVPTIGIPLLSLVASQLPEFSDFIFSWLEPGLRGQ